MTTSRRTISAPMALRYIAPPHSHRLTGYPKQRRVAWRSNAKAAGQAYLQLDRSCLKIRCLLVGSIVDVRLLLSGRQGWNLWWIVWKGIEM
ncbi:hypothetical protein FRC08_012353, partial [Ceratobasidium sp. 394]